MTQLVIVESPTKARTLSRFLGKNFRIEATYGHVRDLPKKKLGVDLVKSLPNQSKTEKDKRSKSEKVKQIVISASNYKFIPQYEVIRGRKPRVAELKKLAREYSPVILATDPDREGEAIAWHIKELLQSRKSKKSRKSSKDKSGASSSSTSSDFQRIVFHEITQSAINEALNHPQDIDDKLVNAQKARRILDRLVGYKLSPLLWRKLGKNWLSAGRVQSVAVRLIVEREREIKAFVPQEYWLIEAELKTHTPSVSQASKQPALHSQFVARLFEIDGKKSEINNQAAADVVVADLEKSHYKVAQVEHREVRRYPVPPFITSTLQQAAANRYGWSAKKTMRAAQNLYEHGIITYHRTDSTTLAKESISKVREYISTVYGGSYLPPQPKLYKTKSKVAQEAHEAIRPTQVKVLSESDLKRFEVGKQSTHGLKSLATDLGRDEQLIYSLVWKRFVACQMKEALFDATRVDIKAQIDAHQYADSESKVYSLRVTGQRVKFEGWMTVYGDKQKSEIRNQKSEKTKDQHGNEARKDLPPLTENDSLDLIKLLPQQKFTQPPARYNEASLIKTLEEKGIGRPSTYAPIISTIQDRKYVEKITRQFHSTDLGFAVTDFLVKHFPEILDVSFTAQMEDGLDGVANGEKIWAQVLSNFYSPFSTKLSQVFKEADRVKVDLGSTDEKCPKCGSQLAYRISRYGKFLACTTYPTCKFTKNIVEKVGIVCPRCKSDMVVKRTRRGKQFYGCSSYPKCTFAAWKKEDIK